MSSPSLRTGTRSLRLRSIRKNPPRTSTSTNTSIISVPRVSIANQSRNLTGNASAGTKTQAQARTVAVPLLNLRARMTTPPTSAWTSASASQLRKYATSTSTPTPTADNLIEELQDLYEIAKDEFEIATDSTDGSTIYAASDRESARDALNQLVTVYELYTGAKVAKTHADGDGGAAAEGEAGVVETNFDPAGLSEEVRGEVRRRVGQRVRELKNAVEILEERAHDE
ncbi:hypothetical protein N7509_012352 [Penicillium cosmopolitanum]|uniref:Uncharacterized protein n=1 Tax=Penicillium cosmopolitanum TaxID=1131564 RepID=A0A9W9SIN5_9EURO|nr:uncharacterized protein N7509_012352 [Penicillium cosmopolitanum]KAJ5379233.1 hypothetical protein N7509_012352 [Penicillium cosmopolitanum]